MMLEEPSGGNKESAECHFFSQFLKVLCFIFCLLWEGRHGHK